MMTSFRLTGRHVAAIFIVFFSIIIAVNVLMASYAIGGFGGTVVDNSYVASQEFNGWLARARQQQALGWQQQTRMDGDRHLILMLEAPKNVRVAAIAEHPLGRSPDIILHFDRRSDGSYRATAPLPAGRWIVRWTVRAGTDEMRFLERNG